MIGPHEVDPALSEVSAAVELAAEALVSVWTRAQERLTPRVSASQLRALMVVAREGRINLGRLAEQLGAIPSSASRLCDRLQAAGLLAREVGAADRREVMLRLTKRGQELIEELREQRRADLGRVLRHMTPAARFGLLLALQGFAAAMAAGHVDDARRPLV